MNAKQKAIKYLREKGIKFRIWQQVGLHYALDIAIREAKKELFDNIENCRVRIHGLLTNQISWNKYQELKQRHLSTFPKEKQHNSGLKKDRKSI